MLVQSLLSLRIQSVSNTVFLQRKTQCIGLKKVGIVTLITGQKLTML